MRVLVVGGGITGLVTARSLALDGVPVLLAEAGPRLGGKVSTEHTQGFTIEHGPDSFLATRPAGTSLVRELRLGDELVGTAGTRAVYIRHRGSLVPMPEGLGLVLPTRFLPFARTHLFSWPEKLRMAKDLVAPRSMPADDVAVGVYLRGRLGSPLVERLAGPLVGGVYGTPIDELSLDAVVPTLRTAEREHRSLLLAGLADGRKMRAAAAKRAAANPGAKPLGAFVSLRGGLGGLTRAVAASASEHGAELRTNFGVRWIARSGAGVSVGFADGSSARFDAVVLATPANAAAVLLDEPLPIVARHLDSIPHGTSVLVTLAYPRDRVGHDLRGHGYLVPRSEGGPIAACTWSSEKWTGRAPADTVLLRMFVRDEGPSTILPETALVSAARADAERTLSISGEPVLVRTDRYEHAMPRYTVGHLDRVAAVEAAMAAWPAVTLAGASYRGVGLPDCIAQGQSAAVRVAERLGSFGSGEARIAAAGGRG